MTTEYIGVIDSMHTWLVRDAQGQVVGMNQQAAGDFVDPAETSS